jgi:hypothetical protein
VATIVYLDAEDEITSAATRIRQSPDRRVGIVIPYGSRVATSRINFTLLSREALVSGKRLDIVAPDASARALAASAGLPVFGSVAEYEAALDAPRDDETKPIDTSTAATAAGVAGAAGAGITGVAAGATGPKASKTQRPARPPDPDADLTPTEIAAREAELDAVVRRSREPQRELPVATPRRRRPRTALIVGLVILMLGLAATAFAAAIVLPSADITVTPHVQAVGPVELVVTADPSATAVDEAAGIIPAQTVDIPISVSQAFPATGKRVEEEPARGAVRWRNCDPSASYTIPSGTVVSTQGGEGFATDESLFLPVAQISGTGANVNLRCTTSNVAVTAVKPGPDGNVPAGAISVVPGRYNRQLISVTNPSATDGGTREEFTRISRRDVEQAMAALQAQLPAELESSLEDPSVAPAGSTLFPETAVLGDATPTVDPETLVAQEVDSFTLGLDALASVLAVDSTPVETIATTALAEAVTPGWELVPDSSRVNVGEGTVRDGVVEFPVAGVAKQVQPLDGEGLRQQVLGLSIDDARALLAPFGDVDIRPWPDMLTTIPTLDPRVTLVILDPVDDAPVEEPVPPSANPTVAPTPTPDGGTPSEPVPSG